jgi:hypothetical protein
MVLPDGNAGFVLGGVVRLGMACVFAQSALSAARDWHRHIGAVAAYGLLPARMVVPVAALLTAGNAAAAGLLVVPASAWWGTCLGCLLLLIYAAAMRINVSRGRTDIDCGCGGARGQKISGLLVGRNLCLAGLLGQAARCPLHGDADIVNLVALVGGAACFVALYFAAGQLIANRAAMA